MARKEHPLENEKARPRVERKGHIRDQEVKAQDRKDAVAKHGVENGEGKGFVSTYKRAHVFESDCDRMEIHGKQQV